MTTRNAFAKWLDAKMLERDITPAALARELAPLGRNVSSSGAAISGWLNEGTKPKRLTAIALARLFGEDEDRVLILAGHHIASLPGDEERGYNPEPEADQPPDATTRPRIAPDDPAVSHHLATYESLSPEAREKLDSYAAFLKAQEEAG